MEIASSIAFPLGCITKEPPSNHSELASPSNTNQTSAITPTSLTKNKNTNFFNLSKRMENTQPKKLLKLLVTALILLFYSTEIDSLRVFLVKSSLLMAKSHPNLQLKTLTSLLRFSSKEITKMATMS